MGHYYSSITILAQDNTFGNIDGAKEVTALVAHSSWLLWQCQQLRAHQVDPNLRGVLDHDDLLFSFISREEPLAGNDSKMTFVFLCLGSWTLGMLYLAGNSKRNHNHHWISASSLPEIHLEGSVCSTSQFQ